MTFLRGNRSPHTDARHFALDPDLSLVSALAGLRVDRSGMAFIYSAMDLFVARFELSDLVVVFQDGQDSTQIFRWGAKPISPDRTSLITAVPGVYAFPSLDDVEDVDLLFEMCQHEFDDLRARGDLSTEASSVPTRVGEELDATDVVEVEDRQLEGSTFGVKTWRPFTSKVFVFITLVNIVLALLDVTGGVRFVLGLVLGLAIPGWSIVGLIHFRDTALEIALSMAASLAIVMMGAQLMITVNLWHLEAFEVFLCLICLPSLLYQAEWLRPNEWRRR